MHPKAWRNVGADGRVGGLAGDMAKARALTPSLRGTVRLGGRTDCFQPATCPSP